MISLFRSKKNENTLIIKYCIIEINNKDKFVTKILSNVDDTIFPFLYPLVFNELSITKEYKYRNLIQCSSKRFSFVLRTSEEKRDYAWCFRHTETSLVRFVVIISNEFFLGLKKIINDLFVMETTKEIKKTIDHYSKINLDSKNGDDKVLIEKFRKNTSLLSILK